MCYWLHSWPPQKVASELETGKNYHHHRYYNCCFCLASHHRALRSPVRLLNRCCWSLQLGCALVYRTRLVHSGLRLRLMLSHDYCCCYCSLLSTHLRKLLAWACKSRHFYPGQLERKCDGGPVRRGDGHAARNQLRRPFQRFPWRHWYGCLRYCYGYCCFPLHCFHHHHESSARFQRVCLTSHPLHRCRCAGLAAAAYCACPVARAQGWPLHLATAWARDRLSPCAVCCAPRRHCRHHRPILQGPLPLLLSSLAPLTPQPGSHWDLSSQPWLPEQGSAIRHWF